MLLLKSLWSVIWRILVFLIGWGILCVPFIIPVLKEYAPNGSAFAPGLRLYVESVTFASILVVAWVMVRFFDRRPFVSLGFARRYAARDSLVGLIIGLGMMTACYAVLYFRGWAKPNTNSAFSGWALTLAALAMILNTATQEVMVRGYMQQTIQRQFDFLSGVIGSAFLFSCSVSERSKAQSYRQSASSPQVSC